VEEPVLQSMSPDGQRTSAPDGDAALVARAAVGDEDAVAAIYDSFAGPLYGYGLRRLGDPLLAEELVQSVMTRVWRTARRYDSERGSVRTWVFTMARSIAIDLYRREGRAVAPAPEPADRPELADDGQDLEIDYQAGAVRTCGFPRREAVRS
jgi:RNA polymerase sigma-70 factor, ECF subfamily